VTAKDAYGNTTPGYAGSVALGFSPAYVGPGPSESAALTGSSAGVSDFRATLYLAGTRTITATGTPSSLAGSNSVTISPGALASLALAAELEPREGEESELTVTAKDAYGNTKGDYTGRITFGASDTNVTFSVDGGETYSRNPTYSFTSGPGLDNGTHLFDDGVRFGPCSSQSGTIAVSDTSAAVQGSLSYSGPPGPCAPLQQVGPNSAHPPPALLGPPKPSRIQRPR
jgi:hypothetical protein